jgi:undecaprenyl diphosphate synthase
MHVGIIMDGNGRWAQQRGLPRPAGHRAGGEAVRRVVEAAVASPVTVLTLYAFSCDNWARPKREVSALMRLMQRYLVSERLRCLKNGVRINVIGRRDRISGDLVSEIEDIEKATASCNRLLLRLAVDYSSRLSMLEASRAPGEAQSFCDFERRLERVTHSVPEVPSLDLLIRTGGERRLSDFLLWESAYAELVFSDTHWPDYGEQELLAALDEFRRRDRRFGQLSKRTA